MNKKGVARTFKWTYRVVLLCVIVVIAAVAFVYWQLSGSLAQLDGDQRHSALRGVVTVDRDAQGIPLIQAQARPDTAFALGYLHAQERFFQMDLLRRNSAGELSALFGTVALAHDRQLRLHQFRQRADQALAALPPDQRTILDAYVIGVNHGLSTLRSKPFEYHLLGATPEPWVASDTLLTVHSMYLDLQPNWNEEENSRAALRDHLPEDWVAFMLPEGGLWDAPIQGATMIFDASLPERPLASFGTRSASVTGWTYEDLVHYGSNSWSVGGDHTEHGGGLLANDM
ncbi:MAG: penicillin acylase family protein, partial [Natronospirillum sp.]